MGFFGVTRGWGEQTPPPLNLLHISKNDETWHSYIAYLKKIQKDISHVTHPLNSIFEHEISIFSINNIYLMRRFRVSYIFIPFRFFYRNHGVFPSRKFGVDNFFALVGPYCGEPQWVKAIWGDVNFQSQGESPETQYSKSILKKICLYLILTIHL